MASHIQCFPNSHYAHNWGVAGGAAVDFYATDCQTLVTQLLSNINSQTWTNSAKDSTVQELNFLFDNETCNYIPPGFSYPLNNAIVWHFSTRADIDYYNSNVAGKSFEIFLTCQYSKTNGWSGTIPCFWFKCSSMPSISSSSTVVVVDSEVCLYDWLVFNNQFGNVDLSNLNPISRSDISSQGYLRISDSNRGVYYSNYGFSSPGWVKLDIDSSGDDCDDSRTSTDTQTLHFVISDGISNAQTFDVSFNLSDGANQEIGLLSPVLSDSAFNQLLNVWNNQTGCTARCQFTGGTVRSSCRVKLVCKVYGQSCKVSPSLVPPFVQLNLSEYGGVSAIDRNLLIADFDPCQDNAVSYSEDVTSYIQGLQQNEDFTVGFSFIQVVPYKVVIENCTALTDYCCDDDESVPADDESLGGYTKPLIQGYGGGSSGGGGGDVDITCICTALSNINTTLSAFASANEAALGDINATLSNLNIDFDNECICNNLEDVVDGLGAIKDSIDDKELSVTNSPTINVAPCQPIVTNPVNNITVTPSTAQITNPVTVQPCQPIVTNPVNNITVTPSTADVNVNIDNTGIESALSDINTNLSAQNDGLICDDKGLACILKEALNTSGLVSESVTDVIKNALNTSDNESEGLTDVIKNKDFGANIDVEVSPADDVNINRVYYTNQRNGDTNL